MDTDFDKVMSIIVDLAANTHPDKMRRLAKRISECPDAESAGSLDNWATSERLRKGLKTLVESWRVSDLSSRELAGILLGTTYDRKMMTVFSNSPMSSRNFTTRP